MEKIYDVVIIGSGLGGLECGVILSKEGFKVCVLEQNAVLGGCLQSFKRYGRTIDTGIHYIGSMGEGQIMQQYMKYFGIYDQLSAIRMDDNFDVLSLPSAGTYSYKQGYDSFIHYLTDCFPEERAGLIRYFQKVKEIGSSIDINVHKRGLFSSGSIDCLSVSAVEFINDCVTHPTLRSVLGGINILHGGTRESTNLYHHAMITHSYLQGAYRFVGGTQKVVELLANQIVTHGGVIRKNSKVTSIGAEGSCVQYVELENGEQIRATHFISNLHPAVTFDMVTKTSAIKKAYRTRLHSLTNTYGLFSTALLMKPNRFPYLNQNFYYFHSDDAWDVILDSASLQPKLAMLSIQKESVESSYADVVSLITPIDLTIFKEWSGMKMGERGDGYKELKAKIEERLINYVLQRHGDFSDSIERVNSATPLTYEYYTGVPQGSAYGILKDCRNPVATLFPTQTKLSNLHLTGQNVNVHGALGVTLTAANTCGVLLGESYLAKRIGES
ncbi:MAG: phytoene desaturase family protein [Phocaeicola sp.]